MTTVTDRPVTGSPFDRAAWPVPFIVAHRANAPGVVENSLAGIRANGALGTDLVELDVRRSLGGTPFIYHDWYLGRSAGPAGARYRVPVRVTPGQLLRRMVLNDSDDEERLPELSDALDLIASDPALPGPALHIKDQRAVRVALSQIRHRELGARTALWLHGTEAALLARSMVPEATVVMVENRFQRTRRQFASHIADAAGARAAAVSLPWWAATDEVLAEATARGVGTVALIHDLDTVVDRVRAGLGGVITDYPDRVRDILAEAGLRPIPGNGVLAGVA
ncbi:MAG TPA: glycerophosphodiester phosphodiesterase family protein [Thermomicrobiales bacterium]|jgi:glycerophosphoryl diester phosphodiesterase|nr:glycerophosphodiester phosphodiesterase family protein [Thermomicrobiales bacterium]